MLTIQYDHKYFYLSQQDVRYIQPSGSGENTEIHLKDGCTLIVLGIDARVVNEKLQDPLICPEPLKAKWRLAAPEFRRKNLVGV
jgi:hypothetical protein